MRQRLLAAGCLRFSFYRAKPGSERACSRAGTAEWREEGAKEAREYGCGTVQVTASDMGVLLYTDFGFVKNGNFMQYKL